MKLIVLKEEKKTDSFVVQCIITILYKSYHLVLCEYIRLLNLSIYYNQYSIVVRCRLSNLNSNVQITL